METAVAYLRYPGNGWTVYPTLVSRTSPYSIHVPPECLSYFNYRIGR